MKLKKSSALLCLALAALPVPEAGACTTFCLRKGREAVFGKNYDWNVGDGLLVVNKRGMAKTAALSPPEKPARWTSRYGSLTFNQYGREFPSGGMNEAGLAVELMWLDQTQYPAPDARPALGCLEWIQYQLDNFATVGEVAKNVGRLRVSADAKIHYMACDKSGSCATVEYLDGKPVVHTGPRLPVQALTNDPYADSLRFREQSRGGSREVQGVGSLPRFARASARVEEYAARGANPVRYAFETLDDVAQGTHTKWSIVYDLKAGRVHWRTRENRQMRSVTLSAFDLSCATPVRVLDVDEGAGDMARRFAVYTPAANHNLVASAFSQTEFLAGLPPEAAAETASHPETTSCTAARKSP
ncbi:MAG TPA: linear amide C-N hydrolase [Thermoanaerobaculia bacterium]|nr:linear amide C-N hydrolase [Thermoanaerobaculia bacterium]